MAQFRLTEPLTITGLVIVVSFAFANVYRDHEAAEYASWQQVTYRVMDSMLPFQEHYHKEHKRFAVGVFDRSGGEVTLANTIDWHSSVTDSNRYVTHVIGNNAYKVIATSEDGRSLCRLYPSKQPCLDLDNYLQRGL